MVPPNVIIIANGDPIHKSSNETSLGKIKNLSSNLENLFKFLDDKMDTVLEKRQKEFLSAYQRHMVEVQEELLNLKRRANEKEINNQSDDKFQTKGGQNR